MPSIPLPAQAAQYLHRFCIEIPSRRMGSAGNRAATDLFATTAAGFGFETECPEFECMDWITEGADLRVEGEPFRVSSSPYSLGCEVSAPLVVAATLAELEASEAAGNILLVRGELAREQLIPKNYKFYNSDEHRHILHLFETRRPAAIVAATSRDPAVTGAVYPFPLIEDGDFDVPSVYMTEEEGLRLAARVGATAALVSRSKRIAGRGCNVIARRGPPARRMVFFAHIDAKIGTPGALDNASGVIVLLLLAELLQDYDGRLGIELVALNGEDYYGSSGELDYLARNAGRFGEILLGINLDGVGIANGKIAFSLYDCAPEMAARVRRTFAEFPDVVEGPQWPQSDHMLFVFNQVPALALTSDGLLEALREFLHTAQDTPEKVDAGALVQAARALKQLVLDLDASGPPNAPDTMEKHATEEMPWDAGEPA